jgi:hypothetical protein
MANFLVQRKKEGREYSDVMQIKPGLRFSWAEITKSAKLSVAAAIAAHISIEGTHPGP